MDINTAAKEDLDALPGIGPVKAQAIIEARPFKTIEDIMKVKGIKDGEFSKIRDLITVKMKRIDAQRRGLDRTFWRRVHRWR